MTAIVTTKIGCRFDRIAPGGFKLLAAIQGACDHLDHSIEITAGTNDHTTGRHVTGEAYDLSVQGWTTLEILDLIRYLRSLLGSDSFAVWYESATEPADLALLPVTLVNATATAPHVHGQVKKGTMYPMDGLVA